MSLITVDWQEFQLLDQTLLKSLPKCSGGYDVWLSFDRAIRKVLMSYGKVGWEDDVDFYHSGDWSHELSNGFCLRTPKALKAVVSNAYPQLQRVVANHHPKARLRFGGEFGTQLEHLECIITSCATYVSLWHETYKECEEKLRRQGCNFR